MTKGCHEDTIIEPIASIEDKSGSLSQNNTFKDLDYEFDITQTDIFLSFKSEKTDDTATNLIVVLFSFSLLSIAGLFNILEIFNYYIYSILYIAAFVLAIQSSKKNHFLPSIILIGSCIIIPILIYFIKN